jgi:hypothetical protein
MRRILPLPSLFVLLHAGLGAQTPPDPTPTEHIDTYPSGAVQRRYEVDEQGRKHGRCEEFTEAGTRTLLETYKHGVRDGEWKEWTPDGRKLRAFTYQAGALHGHCEEFYDNGRSAASGEYRQGLRQGKWLESDRDGVRKKVSEYRQGQLHGPLRITLRDKVLAKQTWRDGDLVQLDDLPPLPIAQRQLLTELRAITAAAPPALDPNDALAADRYAALRRLAAYRRLCGLPFADLTLVPDWNLRCDAAAEICRRIGHLDHTPPRPPDLDEARYKLGYDGASHSNLAVGGDLPSAIDQWMDDSDPSNIDRIGHRRWCLNPTLQKLGFGHDGGYSAMWSMDQSGASPRNLEFVCYPPHGFTPVDLFAANRAFSVGFRKGPAPKQSDLRVSVQPLDDDWLPDGAPLTLDWCAPAKGGFGSLPCVVFRPVGIEVAVGRRYRIEVGKLGEKEPLVRYLVAFCEPMGNDH